MTIEQQWLEYDYNPYILFSSEGKVKSLNSEAQFLLSSSNSKELFELATTYANVTFGFKTTFIDIELNRYKFFGLTVGYENETEIGIKLYQTPSFKLTEKKPIGELTNIYTLVDLCISTNSISSSTTFTKEYDPTIPEIIINSSSFIKILYKIYSCFSNNIKIHTKVYYRVGEHVKFGNKKYSLFSVEISAQSIDQQQKIQLQELVKNNEIFVEISKKITINLPMITK